MDSAKNDLIEALTLACQINTDTLASYSQLATASELTDEAAAQLAAIYTAAETDPLLNFLINELDYILNRRLGLLNEPLASEYKDQQAFLREHLEEMPFDFEYRKQMQQLLSEEGVYDGPIDGVFGKRSKEAIETFHRRIQQMLAERGFYNKSIDGIFGEHSVTAVKQFQKSKALKDDGVPGRKTYQELKLG
ncbi:MAG: peptidoglycan-binding domain-containing protein [Almyronema sp.]